MKTNRKLPWHEWMAHTILSVYAFAFPSSSAYKLPLSDSPWRPGCACYCIAIRRFNATLIFLAMFSGIALPVFHKRSVRGMALGGSFCLLLVKFWSVTRRVGDFSLRFIAPWLVTLSQPTPLLISRTRFSPGITRHEILLTVVMALIVAYACYPAYPFSIQLTKLIP